MNELSICSGYGGIGLGLEIAVPATRTVCFVEREAASCATLVARMQEGSLAEAPIWTDLTTFDGKPWRGAVDIISAGIPCQPWSLAGKQAGFEDERHLGEELVRVVGEVEPRYVFVENVSGFVRLGAPDLLGRLSEIGFDAEWGLFSAAGVGATHRRQRFFLLAYRRGMADTGCTNAGRLQHGRRDAGGGNAAPDAHQAREDVAYRNSGGRGRLGLRSVLDGLGETRGDNPDGCGEGLADSSGGRSRIEKAGDGGGSAGGRGKEVGDPKGERPATRRAEHEGQFGRDASTGTGCELADTERPRPQGEPEPREPGPHDGATRRGGRAAFPPGPNGEWSGIPEEYHPAIESKVRGVADGTPGRVDQLRMLGNGVVPLQAAYAFRTLLQRITD